MPGVAVPCKAAVRPGLPSPGSMPVRSSSMTPDRWVELGAPQEQRQADHGASPHAAGSRDGRVGCERRRWRRRARFIQVRRALDQGAARATPGRRGPRSREESRSLPGGSQVPPRRRAASTRDERTSDLRVHDIAPGCSVPGSRVEKRLLPGVQRAPPGCSEPSSEEETHLHPGGS